MKINLLPFEELEGQKNWLRQKFSLPANIKVDLALDGVHGMNELTRSLADLYPHKRSMAVLGAQPPPLKEITMGLAGQGFHVQELPVSLTEPDEAKLRAAWDALKKDTLFVLTSAAEPLTGALYPFDWIRTEGPKKNIFSLVYFSPDALTAAMPSPSSAFEGLVLDPLWGESFGTALILKGERCQGEHLLWGQSRYSEEALSAFDSAFKNKTTSSNEDAQDVKNFESQIASHLKKITLLHPRCPRLFDRAVLFIEGAHGDALVHALKKKTFDTQTGAACAWKSPHLNAWLPKMGISAELVECSLIVPRATLKKNKFVESLTDSVNELRKNSGFSFQ